MSRPLAAAIVLLAALTPELAHAQVDIDEGKTPAHIFASDCAACHASARGLAHGRGSSALSGFLSEHYTSSSQEAAELAAYVLANGGNSSNSSPAPQRRGERLEPRHPPGSVGRPKWLIPPAPVPVPPFSAVPSRAERPKGPAREVRRPAKPGEAPRTVKPRRAEEVASPPGVEEPASTPRSPAPRRQSKPPTAAPLRQTSHETPKSGSATAASAPKSPQPSTSGAVPATATGGAAAPKHAHPAENAPAQRDDISD